MARGRFITIEGGEGTGKSTQARALVSALIAAGRPAIGTREPGGTPGAEAIRELLMTGPVDRWSPAVEALLFTAARADHVERVIAPALARGEWVVCDRYLDSTLAYQGGASGIGLEALRRLHAIGSGDLMPDRTFLLTAPPALTAGRLAARDGDSGNRDRMGARNEDYYRRVEAAFLNLAHAEPARFRVIDAGGEAADVTARMMVSLAEWL